MRKAVPDKEYNKDFAAHLNENGSLVAGLTLVCFLSGKDPRNCTYNADLGQGFLDSVKTAVYNAIKNPYEFSVN